MIKKIKIFDNHNNEREVYDGLKIGDKVLCKKDYKTTAHVVGCKSNYDVTSDTCFAGKIYTVEYIIEWGLFNRIPCIRDESNCCKWIETFLFEPIL